MLIDVGNKLSKTKLLKLLNTQKSAKLELSFLTAIVKKAFFQFQ